MKVKPCPVCGIGTPRMVHYALPMKFFPAAWEETEDCLYEPMITYKRIECSNCGASTVGLTTNIDIAAEDWNYTDKEGNRSGVVQYIIEEVLEVGDDA